MNYSKVRLNIPNLKDEYTIDTNGIVYNVTKDKYLKGTKITKNNRYTKIHLDKFYPLHRLVAEHFLPNPNNYTEINHIDGNRHNNCADNLEWCNHKENIQHCWKNGFHIHQYGEMIGTHKLTEKEVCLIWNFRYSKTAQQIKNILKLDVSLSCIKHILQGKSWTSVTNKLQ
ncbi:MAG: HNH endonuclease [Candidatus Gastranaerophilales bacterium]|nr:HNH endonuclease [Candidatus Gastranaerophilales bacterium]